MQRPPQDPFLKALVVCGILMFVVFFMGALDVTTGLISLLMPSGEFFIVFLVLLLAGSIWFAAKLNIPVVWYFYRDDQAALPETEPVQPVTPMITPTPVQPSPAVGRHRSYTFNNSTGTLRRKVVS